MPVYRCPYCKQELGSEPRATCPKCGKTMILPGAARAATGRKRRAAVRAALEANAGSRGTGAPEGLRRPGAGTMAMILIMMVVVGGLLVGRSKLAADGGGDRKSERALRELNVFRQAIEQFKDDCQRYPTTEEGLRAILINPGLTNWDGKYVNQLRNDPWGMPYRYRLDDDRVVLYSAGPDKRDGTEDDVPIPEPPPVSNRRADIDLD